MTDNKDDNFASMMEEMAIEEYQKEESDLKKYMEDYNLSLKDIIMDLSHMLLEKSEKDDAVLFDKELDLLIVIKHGIYKKVRERK